MIAREGKRASLKKRTSAGVSVFGVEAERDLVEKYPGPGGNPDEIACHPLTEGLRLFAQRVKDPGRDFLLLLVIELRKSKRESG